MFGKNTYDVIVIGSGSGGTIVEGALNQGLRVAWVDKGPLGGTCAIVGCIPSKMLTVPASHIVQIQEAARMGIHAEVHEIDYQAIMARMRRPRADTQQHMREAIEHSGDELDFFEVEAHFVKERTLQAGDRRIRGDKVFIVAGARPTIPPIDDIDAIDYLTNDNVFDLEEQPQRLLIVGGGYIACELGHFFAAVGTEVTIVQRNERLVPDEEPEISALLFDKMSERMQILTATEVVAARQEGDEVLLTAADRANGDQVQVRGDRVLIAAGRTSNADLLQVENAGIETDARGYIRANKHLETNVENVWALGDVIGKHMFKHTANREAAIAWHNSQHGDHGHKAAMDYGAVPHAVFTYPQIAAVGMTEAEARQDHEILVGAATYDDVAYGMALVEEEGFAKVILDAESEKILGYHIIGPYASILIQEVINLMALDLPAGELGRGMHIHPALPELVLSPLGNLRRG